MMRRFMPVLLVLVVAVTAASLFLYSQRLPALEQAAQADVYGEARGEIRKALLEKHPGMSPTTGAKMVEASWKLYTLQNRVALREKLEARTRALKDRFQDEAGQVYMGGIDSYHWLRHLQNLIKTGHVGDRVEAGVEYDALASRPVDASTRRNVHLYLARPLAWVAEKTGRPLTPFLLFLPAVMLCAVAGGAFACARRIGASDLGAFFASFSITLSPFFLTRLCVEWFDTDIYTIFFPLAILTSYLVALDIRRALPRRLPWALAGGVFVGLYAVTWQGWWFIFDIISIASVLYLLNLLEVCRKEERDTSDARRQAWMFGVFVVSSAVAVMLLNGPAVFADFIVEPVRLSRLFRVVAGSAWPNVYLTVEELSPASASLIVWSLGGVSVFFLGLVGLLFLLVRQRLLRHPVFGCGVMCTVLWYILPFPAARQALRFVLLLVVPAGLAFGLVVGKLREGVEALARREGVRPALRLALRGAFLLPAALYLFFATSNIFASAYGTAPKIDDTWDKTLTRIRERTPSDSVINSWWDFGHWFKARAGRRVLFDGMTQNSPYAYWTARVLLTDDEEAAARILKMLDASGQAGVDMLVEKMGGPGPAVRLTERIMGLDTSAARAELSKVLTPGEVEEVLPLLFPRTAPPAYFILSFDMLNKIAPISFIGNWDFRKVDMWLKGRSMAREDFLAYAQHQHNLTPEAAVAAYWDIGALNEKQALGWFSSVIGYRSDLRGSETWEGLWMFENGVVVDWKAKRAFVMGAAADRRGVPASLLYMEGGVLREEPQTGATLDSSVLIVREDEVVKAILLPPALGKSLLLRLYYMKGEGLKHFRLWSEEADEAGNAIYVYELVWPD